MKKCLQPYTAPFQVKNKNKKRISEFNILGIVSKCLFSITDAALFRLSVDILHSQMARVFPQRTEINGNTL